MKRVYLFSYKDKNVDRKVELDSEMVSLMVSGLTYAKAKDFSDSRRAKYKELISLLREVIM